MLFDKLLLRSCPVTVCFMFKFWSLACFHEALRQCVSQSVVHSVLQNLFKSEGERQVFSFPELSKSYHRIVNDLHWPQFLQTEKVNTVKPFWRA